MKSSASISQREIDEIECVAREVNVGHLDRDSIRITLMKSESRTKYPYAFFSEASEILWRRKKPLRRIDMTLGYPILVVNDEGEYAEPVEDNENDCSDPLVTEEIRDSIRTFERCEIYSKTSSLHDVGVFAGQRFESGSYIGIYGGTVMTDEEWERDKPDGQYVFVIHHGRQGVVVDGEVGPTNELKHINHSCDPNARMIELFEKNSWFVVVLALRDIDIGDEITHDYGLTTEDPEDPDLNIQCKCGSSTCRGTLFQYREW